nr:unnamed protein product [Callosobruchus analis]
MERHPQVIWLHIASSNWAYNAKNHFQKLLVYFFTTSTSHSDYSKEDNLSYGLIEFPQNIVITKHATLSQISQIYDPLALLSACTILAKITLQQLWLVKLS